jgi:hypothetical protein
MCSTGGENLSTSNHERIARMKRLVSACRIVFVASLFVASIVGANAQSIKVNTLGISLNQLPTAPKPVWGISNGLNVVGKGTTVWVGVDTTGSGASGSATWQFNGRPGGSVAAFDSTSGQYVNSFKADTIGFYYLQVSLGTQTATDTVFVSTYVGMTTAANAGCVCHGGGAIGDAAAIKSTWQQTGHARIFSEGITGQLEVDAVTNSGAYTKSCVQCHTTGWQPGANNGNFGYVAHNVPAPGPTAWDSTWFAGLTVSADGDFAIPYNDSTRLKALPSQLKPLAAIGCESCHGPLADHAGFTSSNPKRLTRGKSMDAAVCNQCHNGSSRHSLGSYYMASTHETGSGFGHATTTSCFPCHSGSAFIKWVNNNKNSSTVSWSAAEDAGVHVSCAACHNPHGEGDPTNNPWNLRTLTLDSLRNGYKTPAGVGGFGLLCTNCHNSRYSVKSKVTTKGPYYGFSDRFGPHENPQADMFFGSNGYQYGDNKITGQGTHMGLQDACVTCHMQDRVKSGNTLPNHQMSMNEADYAGTGFAPITVCRNCHGQIDSYDDIKASYDYDHNGTIEGVQTEINGLLTKLKAILPIDSSTGEPITMMKDSLKVKNHPEIVQALWNYYFVKNDGSMGIHNAKYAVALLQKSLGWYPTGVKSDGTVPTEYALNQNYPNPFNPTTNISFALPNKESVRLEVYDILGKLVTTLVDREMGSGTYTVAWDGKDMNGSKLTSGVYFYRLQAGSFSAVKKMVMVK